MKEPLYLHGSPKSLAGRLTITSTPPHICNNREIFVTFNETTEGLVATIGGKLRQPTGIGTVQWTWKYDGGAVHTEQLENTLYFPSPQST